LPPVAINESIAVKLCYKPHSTKCRRMDDPDQVCRSSQ